jgi:hypothetical protein
LNDAAGERLVSGLLRDDTRDAGEGLAQALRTAQLALIAAASGSGVPAEVAHPFFWAPMALIGEGGARHLSTQAALKGPAWPEPASLEQAVGTRGDRTDRGDDRRGHLD